MLKLLYFTMHPFSQCHRRIRKASFGVGDVTHEGSLQEPSWLVEHNINHERTAQVRASFGSPYEWVLDFRRAICGTDNRYRWAT